MKVPVLFGYKGTYFSFALDDEADSYGLNPSGRETTGNLGPK